MEIPPQHIPYLERNNIFKLFHQLARELVIQQPDDHVFFIKYLLTNAVNSVRIPHVIILGSPKLNLLEIATQISLKTQQTLISGEMLKTLLNVEHLDEAQPTETVLAIQSIMHSKSAETDQHGWIMVNCINSKESAQKLLASGILPTHVFYLISPCYPKLTEILYNKVAANWPKFRRNMCGIVEVFRSKLTEIYIDDMDIEDLVAKCAELTCIEHIEKGPKRMRVVILGPRGCGRKTQAKLLAQKYHLIHIDYEYLLCQVWVSDSSLGKELRACGDAACFQSAILVQILNKRILEKDCINQGWVLTGFPFCALDMKFFDCVETPPNRVIFLECDLSICLDRILKRKFNVHTGSVTNFMKVADDEIRGKLFMVHPKDKADLVNAELQYYCTHYGSLRKYCGGTAIVINAAQPQRCVHDNIIAGVMRDLPAVPARDPFEGVEPTEADLQIVMPYLFFNPERN